MGHLLYFIFLNVIMTTDAGFMAPLFSRISEIFNVSDTDISWLISIMSIASAVFLPLWGMISDKVNRVYMIFFMVLAGALISLCTVFTITARSEFWFFGLMRLLAVVINTSLGPAIFTLLADLVASRERGVIIGWMGIAGTVAIGMGFIVSGIIPAIIYGDDFPLAFPFWFDFFAGIGFCGLTLLLKEPERGAKDEGLMALHEKGERYEYSLTLDGARDILKKKVNLQLLLFTFLIVVGNSALGTFFIKFLEEQHGLGTGLATLIMFGVFGVQLAGQIYWGGIGDRRFKERKEGRLKVMIRILSIGSFFLVPAFLIPFDFQDRSWMFYIFAIIMAIGSFFAVGVNPNRGVLVADVNYPEERGTVNSIMFLANTAATASIAPIFAMLAERTPLNYSGAFFLVLAVSLPSSILVLLPMRETIGPGIEKIQEDLRKRVER
ncbi:MAG: MFS transporter [Candidatus Hodarchaeota archaeon]